MFLNGFIEKNSRIRELPIYDKPGQDTPDRIAAMEIPKKGRDPMTVGEELVEYSFCNAKLVE